MSKERDLRICTLKAGEIIRLIEDRGGVFDLNSGFIRESILEGRPRRCSDNGLTDQLMFVIEDRAGHKLKRGRLASLLTENLVYLDFGRKLPEDSSAFRRLIEEGFSLIFRGKKDPVRFVASEKSASMARENVISFINADIYDDVDRRLGLDIDWQAIKVIPSKYYAYRGLYLTDGTAVVNDELELNEKTVIVLPMGSFGDDFARHEIEILTTDTGVSEDGRIEISDRTTGIRTAPLDPSLYDGEGIVSPAYARLMAGSLESTGDGKPSSFQIRMPFTKGMLHMADFKRFIAEQFPDAFFDRLTVKDIFGIERRLADAEIILTGSMFKCGKWLRAYFAGTKTDPMKYYFDKFREFDHALYVCKTDLNLRNTGRVRMNYQFFSTLDMDADTFDAIVARHISDSHLIGRDHGKSVEAVMGKALYGDDGDDLYDDGTYADEEESWGYALRRNAAFVNDPFIRSRIRETEKSRILDVMRGNVLVEGINKYLSGDLLSLLITIAKMSGAGDRERIGELYKKTLHSDRFYISDRDSYALRRNYHYGMLRSPHLSRNEQCALRPYADESIYDEYFSHLNGVVMVSNLSYAPIALGGADYDGDTVKIILDRDINKAILRGAYEEYTYTGHDGKERRGYKRKLPVVSITTPDGHWRTVGKHISYEDVRAAFSNDIGKISNLAIDLGSMEYGEGTLAPGTTAMCTIATGLEIDSVKTGRSPALDYLESLRAGGDGEEKPSYYLKVYREFRQKYLDLEWKRGKTVYAEPHTCPDGYSAYLKAMVPDGTYTEVVRKGKIKKKANKEEKKEELFTAEAGKEINIDRLPFHYTEDLYENPPKKGRGAKIKIAGAPEYRFTFESDDGWKEKAEKDPRREALAGMIRSYYKARRDTVDVSSYRKNKDTLRSTIEALLDIEYDLERDRLPRTGVDVMTALDTAYEEMYEALPGFMKAVEALKAMRKTGWQYIRGYELKREALSGIVDTGRLSESTIELLCDTYDNGYQILNYLLIDTLESRRGRRDENAGDVSEESNDERDIPVFNEDLYAALLESSRDANENKRSRTRWLRTAGDICRREVLKLFDRDIESAVACTVLLGAGEDRTHTFLWGVFRPEDLKSVIYTGSREAAKGGRDA